MFVLTYGFDAKEQIIDLILPGGLFTNNTTKLSVNFGFAIKDNYRKQKYLRNDSFQKGCEEAEFDNDAVNTALQIYLEVALNIDLNAQIIKVDKKPVLLMTKKCDTSALFEEGFIRENIKIHAMIAVIANIAGYKVFMHFDEKNDPKETISINKFTYLKIGEKTVTAPNAGVRYVCNNPDGRDMIMRCMAPHGINLEFDDEGRIVIYTFDKDTAKLVFPDLNWPSET